MRRRALVVDDDELVREIVRTVLELEGIDVSVAVDGSSALAQLARHRFDVVICDVRMPGLDGFEVCRQIKSDAATADVPVILLSATDRAEYPRAGHEAGCDAYLTKPFSPLVLVDLITTVAGTDTGGDSGSDTRRGAGPADAAPVNGA